MKIIKLLISDITPLSPPFQGGPKRIWNLYSNLGDRFDVTYVGIDCGLSKEYIDRKIRDNFREIILPITKMYYPFRFFELKALRNAVFDIFVHIGMIFDRGFKKELNRHRADVLVATHPWASPCFRIKKDQVFIYDAHNCEYLLIKDILKGKWYGAMVSFFVKLIERSACRKAAIIIASSKKDKDLFVELYKIAEEKIAVVLNGACIQDQPSHEKRRETRLKLKISDDETIVLFIGTFYKPNIGACEFIVNEIAPKLPESEIVILGSVSEYFRSNNVPKNVRLINKVDDAELYDWLTASDVGINPMFTGSGINMKMMDYFAFGLPVVTTKMGARGIDGVDSEDFIVCEKNEFTDRIKYLLDNLGLRNKIGMNARKLAEEKYNWKNLSNRVEVILEACLEK